MSQSATDSSTIRIGPLLAWSLLAFALGVFLSRLSAADGNESRELPTRRSAREFVSPRPEFTPREVVELQMQSLRESRVDPSALWQCYYLASVANRAITGPFERFERMVLQPGYLPLTTQRDALIGEAIVRDQYATVLVTVVDQHRVLRAYRFLLSKQLEEPYVDCWMTEAVFSVDLPAALPPVAESRDV